MPIIRIIDSNAGTIGVWRVEESIGQLLQMYRFTHSDNLIYPQLKSENRRREFLITRILLNKVTGFNHEISYLPDGAPLIKDSDQFLSVSHSSDIVAVIVGQQRVGIDVENLNRDISHIASRFLSEQELNFIEKCDQPEVMRLICWCAKEAAFKYIEGGGVDFKRMITIEPFCLNKNGASFYGTVRQTSQLYKVIFSYLFIENSILVYCIGR